nr:uncharacterized protein LOC112027102 [Quercus suber]
MNLLCWNYRRLGNPQTEQELRDIIRAQGPSVMFLAKTWIDKARLIFIRDKLKFEGKVDKCRRNLKWWSKVAFRNVTRKLKENKNLLGLAKVEAIRGGSIAWVLRLKNETSKLLVREEQMWKQRSHSLWLQEGDNSTSDEELFTSSNLAMNDAVVDQIPCLISYVMNEELVANFTKEEVVEALKQMEPLKARGPDGLPPLFFQHYWHAIGVVANRMKGLLPLIISDSQSAFQSDKAILDNILVAFETLYHMKNQKPKKGGFMAFKLDMSKAYDRVEWRFLELTMRKMGFCNRWVDLIMSCIGLASYQVLVNGFPRRDIRPTRGIRHGDPLFPYLFLVCSEALNQQLQYAANSRAIRGFFKPSSSLMAWFWMPNLLQGHMLGKAL